jgi:hypothetical protein
VDAALGVADRPLHEPQLGGELLLRQAQTLRAEQTDPGWGPLHPQERSAGRDTRFPPASARGYHREQVCFETRILVAGSVGLGVPGRREREVSIWVDPPEPLRIPGDIGVRAARYRPECERVGGVR